MLQKSLFIALAAFGIVGFLAFFSLNARARPGRVVVFDHITVGDKRIAVHADGKPDAIILQDGSLLIGDAAQSTPDAQKVQLKAYYDNALALRAAAIGAGEEGMATAGTAIASVVKGLTSGDPEHINDEVNQQAAKVDAHAKDIDSRLATMRTLQNEIVAGVPAFAPYAFLVE